MVSHTVRMFPLILACACAIGCVADRGTPPVPRIALGVPGGKPLVIAHRGASGERPEHTLAAYQLAIEQGADFLEPDLVSTKDGALIARHENEISETTDVATRFPDRKTRKVIDGKTVEGWFSEDLTLAEVKSLRAKERLPFRSQKFNGLYAVPTLDEVITLVKETSRKSGRSIGLYLETKHPGHFRSIGLAMEPALLSALEREGWTTPGSPVFIQSFEQENLRWLRGRTGVRLVQLVDASGRPPDFARRKDPRTYSDLLSPTGLAEVRTYADGIGVNKQLLVSPRLAGAVDGRSFPPVVGDAHRAGLFVHVWTFRSDPAFLAPEYRGDPLQELKRFYAYGVDGVFTDFPRAAVEARDGPAGTSEVRKSSHP